MVSTPEEKRDSSRKHYSFLNILDNMATFSAEPTLAPSTMWPRSDTAVKRLSSTLHSLTNDQYGLRHLPEVSVVSNGFGISSSSDIEACPAPVVRTYTPRGPNSKKRLLLERNRQYKTLSPLSFGNSFKPDVLADIPQLQSSKRNSTIRPTAEAGPSKRNYTHTQPRLPYPVSMYSTSTVRKMSAHKNSGSHDAAPDRSRPIERLSNFEDQRYEVVNRDKRQHNDIQPQHLPFKLMKSFKDLRSEKKRKTNDEHKGRAQEEGRMHHSSLHEALRGGVRPVSFLHDAMQDKLFSEECAQMLSYQPDLNKLKSNEMKAMEFSSKPARTAAQDQHSTRQIKDELNLSITEALVTDLSVRKSPRPQASLSQTPVESSSKPRDVNQSTFLHTSSNGHISLHKGHIVGPIVYLSAGNITNKIPKADASRMAFMSSIQNAIPPPTAPPERPLPPLPGKHTDCNGCNGCCRPKTGRIHAIVNKRLVRREKLVSEVKPSNSPSKTDRSRVKVLAASKGLSINSTKAAVISCWSSQIRPKDSPFAPDCAGQSYEDSFPSPLKLQPSRTGRNAKVHELKKRHLSMRFSDPVSDPTTCGGDENAKLSARRRSMPPVVDTSASKPIKLHKPKSHAHRKRLPSDRKKPLPLTPTKTHNREDSATLPQTWGGMQSNPDSMSLRAEHCRRISCERIVSEQLLARSNVMILVESDPQSLYGFRAGTVGLTRSQAQKRRTSAYRSDTTSCKRAHKQTASISSCSTAGSLKTQGESTITALTSDDESLRYMCAESHQNGFAVPATTFTRPHECSSQDQNSMRDEINRLDSVLERMTRVCGSMTHARQSLTPQGSTSYAELLEDDRKASHIAQTQGTRYYSKRAVNEILQRRRSAASSPDISTTRSSSAFAPPEPPSDLYLDSPSRPRTAGGSDTSASVSISFQRISSDSSDPRARKYSDSSMTSPSDYECPLFSTPLGGSQTTIKPSTRTSLLMSKATASTTTTSRPTVLKMKTERKPRRSVMSVYSPYPKCVSTKRVLEMHKSVDAASAEAQGQQSALASVPMSLPTAKPAEDQQVEFEHFLIETDQVDHAFRQFCLN